MTSRQTSSCAELKVRSSSSAICSVSWTATLSSLLITIALTSGCSRQIEKSASTNGEMELATPCRIALATTAAPDSKISELQEKVRTSAGEKALEDLGWAFIDKARTS